MFSVPLENVIIDVYSNNYVVPIIVRIVAVITVLMLTMDSVIDDARESREERETAPRVCTSGRMAKEILVPSGRCVSSEILKRSNILKQEANHLYIQYS